MIPSTTNNGQYNGSKRWSEGESEPPKKPRGSAAERLVRLAEEQFQIGRTPQGEPFAVRRDGPNLALMFRGGSEALRAALARKYRGIYKRVPNASALSDALLVLQGVAQERDADEVGLRVAERSDALVLDLGDAMGRAVVVTAEGWTVVDRSPVLFRRTALTDVLPVPVRGGSLSDLLGLLNIKPVHFDLLIGWLVAAFFPAIAHPVLLLGGGQGTGKTTASDLISGLFDPCTAGNHNVPRDPEAWAMAVSGAWGVTVDNVSVISEWWSDILCKTVTCTGWVRRALYTNSDLSVLKFRRVITLTSIDPGALRGDLADRLLLIDLERIPDERRREEREIKRLFSNLQPELLGALLDLVAGVLRLLPETRLGSLPRMADFAKVLAALDRIRGTKSLSDYFGQRDRIAEDVLAGDAVGEAVAEFIRFEGAWSGKAGQLWDRLTPTDKRPAGWPKSARGMSGRLKRLIPALEQLGVEVIPPSPTDKTRTWSLTTAHTAQPPEIGTHGAKNGPLARADDSGIDPNRPGNRPTEGGAAGTKTQAPGRLGGSGGSLHDISDPCQPGSGSSALDGPGVPEWARP